MLNRRPSVVPLLCILFALSSCGRSAVGNAVSPPKGASSLPSGMFVAKYEYGAGDGGGGHGTFLSLFDERTGLHTRDLVHIPEGSPIRFAGYTRSADGDIWYVLVREQSTVGHVETGRLQPTACGGTVYRIDHLTGVASEAFRVSVANTISSPALSPDGKLFAYASEPCTAGSHSAVIVQELARGAEHRIGVTDASADAPSWSLDGRRLAFSVFSSAQNSRADDPGFVVVDAQATGELSRTMVFRSPDRGCTATAAVFSKAGIALVEGCPDQLTPPAKLLQLDDAGWRILWRAQTELCPSGASLVADPTGTKLLVTAAKHCDGDPVIKIVQAWEGKRSTELGRYTAPMQFLGAAAW